jgi:hypothetical protein
MRELPPHYTDPFFVLAVFLWKAVFEWALLLTILWLIFG